MTSDQAVIPIVELSPLLEQRDRQGVADQIGQACRNHGFFYVTGHGIDEQLSCRLEQLSREFFAQDLEAKMAIRMELGGSAWRGYFPVGDELTSGQPDRKEGIYFGAELDDVHPKVKAGLPLHGRNLFPAIPGFREAVLQYMAAMTHLGHALMEAIAISLELEPLYFADRYTRDPLILFRIFHYPAFSRETESKYQWSVGEHTDYGILTILRQDESGGLQIKSRSRWIDAPPIPGALVCNIGDMLDRMTGGLYRSTPHRVRNTSDHGRLSFPFFFDPDFDAEVRPIYPNTSPDDDHDQRWDKASVHQLSGTYGDYIMKKVAKVFPDLGRDQL